MADRFRYDLIPDGSAVLCALSGGADSMYLLSRLVEGGYRVHAAHYNHRLRPAADEEEGFVRTWCRDHNIPLVIGSGDVSAWAAQHRTGVEEAARTLRYAFLREAAEEAGCSLIATGHHAGDNAETVLMNLIRGCGLNGLSGIPVLRDGIVRPMLEISREDILAYLSAHEIPHVEDESNRDLSYTRNKIRHRLLPLLEELNPQALDHIAAVGRRAAEDDGELLRQARLLFDDRDFGSLSTTRLAQAPRPVAIRALSLLAPQAQACHLEAMLGLCGHPSPSARVDIPGGTVRRVYDRLVTDGQDKSPPPPMPLREGEQAWGGWQITCSLCTCPAKAYVSREEFYLRNDVYRIRSRREGDALRLGPRPQKTIKKLMIEEQIPCHLRAGTPVLADGADRPAAAGGLGPHREALARPGESCFKITIRKGE